MDARDALAALDALLQPRPAGVATGIDHEGEVVLFVRRDMLHLDADALHDRLHHWTLRELSPAVPSASAVVSFRHARPADPYEESTLDAQEGWLDLEPMLRLDPARASRADVERLVAMVPRFLALVEASGRPPGFRRVDMGSME